jgi:hypothetical protein
MRRDVAESRFAALSLTPQKPTKAGFVDRAWTSWPGAQPNARDECASQAIVMTCG